MNKKVLKPNNSSRPKKIVGRGSGSKKGGTSGKGHKGYNARSGTASLLVFEGGQMPIVRKLPKVGFSNYPFKKNYQIVSLSKIDSFYQEGEEVNAVTLKKKGIINSKYKRVKIVGEGELRKKVTVTSEIAITRSVAEVFKSVGVIYQEKK